MLNQRKIRPNAITATILAAEILKLSDRNDSGSECSICIIKFIEFNCYNCSSFFQVLVVSTRCYQY